MCRFAVAALIIITTQTKSLAGRERAGLEGPFFSRAGRGRMHPYAALILRLSGGIGRRLSAPAASYRPPQSAILPFAVTILTARRIDPDAVAGRLFNGTKARSFTCGAGAFGWSVGFLMRNGLLLALLTRRERSTLMVAGLQTVLANCRPLALCRAPLGIVTCGCGLSLRINRSHQDEQY